MILVDANLLLYAANRAAPEHDQARTWLDGQLNGPAAVGAPLGLALGVRSARQQPRGCAQPVEPAVAMRQVRAWLGCVRAWIPQPGSEHEAILTRLLEAPSMTSRLVPDAHLAASALEHGLTLCSTDGDFVRFAGLRWTNPLASTKP